VCFGDDFLTPPRTAAEAGQEMNCKEPVDAMAAKGLLDEPGRQDAASNALQGHTQRAKGQRYRGPVQEDQSRQVRRQRVPRLQYRQRPSQESHGDKFPRGLWHRCPRPHLYFGEISPNAPSVCHSRRIATATLPRMSNGSRMRPPWCYAIAHYPAAPSRLQQGKAAHKNPRAAHRSGGLVGSLPSAVRSTLSAFFVSMQPVRDRR
jgi:hypothetical protein